MSLLKLLAVASLSAGRRSSNPSTSFCQRTCPAALQLALQQPPYTLQPALQQPSTPSWQGASCFSRLLSSSASSSAAGGASSSSESTEDEDQKSRSQARQGPPEDRMRAIPFTVSRQQAEASYDKYHTSNPLLASAAKWEKVKEVFLPFWMASVRVHVDVRSAQVGHNKLVSYYNPATKRTEARTETTWQSVLVGEQYERYYPPEDPGCQIYASYKYPRPDINALRPGGYVAEATTLSPSLFTSPSDNFDEPPQQRRVTPFIMPPEAARTFALNWISQSERSSVEEQLRRRYRADSVRLLDMAIQATSFSVHPVLVPAFVFRSRVHGVKIHTFVAGFSIKQVSGTQIYDASKLGAVTAFAVPLLLWFSGAVSNMQSLFWLGAMLPGLLIMAASRYYPYLRQSFHKWSSQRAQAKQHSAHGDDSSAFGWEAEWVREYLGREDARRRLEEEAEDQQQQSSSSSSSWTAGGPQGSSSDPLGYYSALGLQPDATTSDVQSAFRTAALKNHPDRVTGEKEKKQASAAFVRINTAYRVLRDPAKRRQYDQGQYRA